MPHKLGCAVPTATPPPAPANTRSHFAGMRTIAGPSRAVMNLREVSQWPEMVPTRTFSLLKVPTRTIGLLRHWNWSKNHNRQAILRLFANKIEISRRFVDSSNADNWRAQCYHYHHYLGLPRPPSTRPLQRLRLNFCQIFSKPKVNFNQLKLSVRLHRIYSCHF